MKLIKFNIADTAGADILVNKIHSHLLTKHGVNGYIYTASRWENVSELRKDTVEGKIGVQIDSTYPSYDYIVECLTQDEINSIETVESNWGSSNSPT
jgi:hypothetical protein